jgi:pheromone shutdown protein TraB
MRELADAMPGLVETLIHERDLHLARRILDTPGQRLVAVVGAGHVAGIRSALAGGARVDLDALNTIPPVSPVFKASGWGLPALILAGLAWIGSPASCSPPAPPSRSARSSRSRTRR